MGLALCLLLTACGSTNEAALESDIIVHVEVNPSFDIHVNDDGTIKKVDCLNEDAQTVYAEMDLTGAGYEDGFKQLLTAIYDAGFIKEEAKLTVEIKQKTSVTFEVSKVTEEVLADFNANVVPVESNVSSEVVKEEQAGGLNGVLSSVMDQLNPTWEVVLCVRENDETVGFDEWGEILLNITLKLDDNKHIIKVGKEGLYANAGAGAEVSVLDEVDITGMYLMDGVCKLLDNMGLMKKDSMIAIAMHVSEEPSPNSLSAEMYEAIEQYQSSNGLQITYYSGNDKYAYTGKEICIYNNGDGTIDKAIHTIESDKLILAEIFYSDGRYGEQHFDENRNPVLVKETSPNGDRMEERREYDENGECVYMYRETIGSYNTIAECFWENGKSKKEIYKDEYGDISTTIFDENGMYLECITEYADGNKWITKFNAGNIVSNTHYGTDGTVTKYDADGNVIE